MSKNGSSQKENVAGGQGNDDVVASAIQELLAGMRGGSSRERVDQDLNVERTASDYAAIILRKQETQRVQRAYGQPLAGGLASMQSDFQRMVQQVRAHFLALADLEIRRMMDDILFGGAMPRVMDDEDQETEHPEIDVRFEEAEEEQFQSLEAPKNDAPETPAEDQDAPEPTDLKPDEEDLYEGTVRLVVMAGGNMQRVVRFVDELCQKPQLRMLRMAGSPQQQGAEISLGLREPLAFRAILAKIESVQRIEADAPTKAASERTVTVHLAAEAA